MVGPWTSAPIVRADTLRFGNTCPWIGLHPFNMYTYGIEILYWINWLTSCTESDFECEMFIHTESVQFLLIKMVTASNGGSSGVLYPHRISSNFVDQNGDGIQRWQLRSALLDKNNKHDKQNLSFEGLVNEIFQNLSYRKYLRWFWKYMYMPTSYLLS